MNEVQITCWETSPMTLANLLQWASDNYPGTLFEHILISPYVDQVVEDVVDMGFQTSTMKDL